MLDSFERGFEIRRREFFSGSPFQKPSPLLDERHDFAIQLVDLTLGGCSRVRFAPRRSRSS